jgi:hypothetical protein
MVSFFTQPIRLAGSAVTTAGVVWVSGCLFATVVPPLRKNQEAAQSAEGAFAFFTCLLYPKWLALSSFFGIPLQHPQGRAGSRIWKKL